ncbi:DUF3885 domain-containing protein [Streptomyces sp. NPDC001002]
MSEGASSADRLTDVFVTDPELRRIHHPYDGGADLVLTTPEERDALRGRHADWLPRDSAGL